MLKKSPPNAETRLNQSLGSGPTNGVFDQRRPALKPELFPNVEAVGFDGFCAQSQLLPDLAGSQSLPEQSKDFIKQIVELAPDARL